MFHLPRMTPCLHLGPRTLLAFRGPDALRYLNGQVTQEVRGIETSDEARPACVTDAKGRLQAYVHIFRSDAGNGELWLEAPAELEEELEARLGRYLIADDAELENISAAWELWHLPGIATFPGGPALARNCNRLGEPGLDLWLPRGSEPGFPLMSAGEAEARRIAARIPAWGAELRPGMLPPEAGLDREAISYSKGCYIGQEVLSRMKSAGKVNRRLTAFLLDEGVAAGAALALTEADPAAKPAGIITSVSPQAEPDSGLYPALGYLEKSGFEARELRADGKRVQVR